jgi:predicted metal-dependent phosphotriesterase family hydrolase
LPKAVSDLNELHGLDLATIMDPTVLGLGRYIPRIQKIADQPALNIVVCTGLTQRVSAEEGVDLAKVIIGHSRDTDGVDNIVISHDSSCFIDFFDPADRDRLVPNWNCRHISNAVLPALLEAGLDEADIESILVQNPTPHFTV